ncbi:glycoside hydrolase family 31 protein [Bacillus solitudinis]|uniref:glycoside hydrolase family 31 protein n=1 Tax=Bacillus solitudinis TaxID=2014074 RepID=UPI000C2352D9|nr:TIM-barrel domain-containing protein [Bacillus solitudinis]
MSVISKRQESLLTDFFEIHHLQLSNSEQEALSALRAVITRSSSTTVEHSLWTWLLTEHVLRFGEFELMSEFESFIETSVELIEGNWNKPQTHLYLSFSNDIFTLHLAIYYSSLVNLKNIGYNPSIQQTATAIRDRVFEGQLKGGMVICSPNHPFASTDLLLSVLPFGLFSPEDLVMVEAVKDIEHSLVQGGIVSASPLDKTHSEFGAVLLSWYFLEKGDQSKSKHYLKLAENTLNLVSSHVKNIINHYLSLEDVTLITHDPYGNENKYEPQLYERIPHKPIENEEVTVRFTAPFSSEASASLYVIHGSDERKVKADYISGDEPYWKANIGAFTAHTKVSYFIEWVGENQSLRTENYVFFPLKKIELRNLTGKQMNHHQFKFWPNDINFPLALFIDTKKQVLEIQKENVYGKHKGSLKPNHVLANQQLPCLVEDPYVAPIQILVDYTGKWVDLSLRFHSPLDERFFGMGERYHRLEYRGEQLDCYLYNQYRDQGARTYMPMPFFISSLNYGLHVKTSHYTKFDFANCFDDVLIISIGHHYKQKETTTLQFYKGYPIEVVSRFTNDTGPAEMLPVWALGPWMSSNNWDRDSVVREQVKKTTELNIPSTVLVLEQWSDETTYYIFNDAIYSPTDGSSALSYEEFTYPKWGRWPNPKGLVDFIHDHGMELILWQIPIMKYLNRQHHPQKDNDESYMLEKGYYIKDKNMQPYRMPEGWFKESLLMDFSNPEGAKWWFDKRQYLLDIGVAGFKTDGGEMVFGDTLQFADSRLGTEMRNEYPNDYIEAYYHFAQKHRPNNAMTFSRSGYTGAQKFPAHWAGDERSTFDAFKRSLIAGLSSGLSGVIMWGWDLAGFNGDIPSAELFIRSAQMAAFCPIMQYHAESKAEFNQDRTPWNIAERTGDERAISGYRYFANVRMNLLPYITEQATLSVSQGIPLMRAMMLECPDDPKTFTMYDQYFFGENLLVAPVIKENTEKRSVYLPAGKWIGLFNKEVHNGDRYIELDVPLMEIPVLQRNNSVLITNVPKDNRELGSFVGNSIDSYAYPVIHIASDQSFDYSGTDHLGEVWKITVGNREDKVVINVFSNRNEYSIKFTNTSDVDKKVQINRLDKVIIVGTNNTSEI